MRQTTGLPTIRRRVGAKLGQMTKAEAAALSDRIRAHSVASMHSMENPAIRELTGGFCSQSLNAWVARRVAVRAGILPKGAA